MDTQEWGQILARTCLSRGTINFTAISVKLYYLPFPPPRSVVEFFNYDYVSLILRAGCSEASSILNSKRDQNLSTEISLMFVLGIGGMVLVAAGLCEYRPGTIKLFFPKSSLLYL